MERRFISVSKVTLRIMCLMVVITLLRNIKILNSKSWYFLRYKNVPELKYILLWTSPFTVPFVNMGAGRSGFISRKCAYTNCVVTANKSLLGDIGKFEVIAFHAPEVIGMDDGDLPWKRMSHQKYVFASIESSDNYPLCSERFDGYFNWTWTYKLDSEVRWGYIVIRNSKGAVIGPSKDMTWRDQLDMDNVSNKLKESFKNKTRAVAWFVSNCITKSRREGYVLGLQKYLHRYNLQIDIIGQCGHLECPRNKEKECYKLVEKHYYFYLSFENAFSEDYVTEKLLIPLQNTAIPIVYGGADYSRFLPPDSYLDARKLGIYELGNKINELIHDPEQYASYFKWKNHYSYHRMMESRETDEYCQMCALLNNEEKMRQKSVYNNLREWWDSSNSQCPDE